MNADGLPIDATPIDTTPIDTTPARSIEVLIIGAGFGGLAMAHALDDLGIDDYLIVEKADAVGGTWRDNTYPGAACDVPSHLYSLSFAPNPFWSRLFPRQGEIRAHMERFSARWRPRMRFGWTLRSACWNEQTRRWRVESTTGECFDARFLIAAMGGLHIPNWPDLPGRDHFVGAHCHTARWHHDIDFSGKRVGVIGTGTSAIQVIPELAKVANSLHVFQRTPVWVLPRPDWPIPGWLQRAFASVPALRLTLRALLYAQLEMLSLALFRPRTAFWARALARLHLRRQVPDPALRNQLQADYPIGCKRIALSSDYYPALVRDNVQLETADIAAIEPEGVRLADGRLIALDVLVYATGFRPMDVLANVDIIGAGGQSLAMHWAERPTTANGIAVPGFPNLFFLLGPNTALGHNSVLYMIESQTRHIVAKMRAMREQARSRIEATPAAEARFMQQIDHAFVHTAWAGGCRSWYLDAQGKNIALWVGTAWSYRRRLMRPGRDEYQID